MSRFKELSEYKNNILIKLISNENLIKALTNNTPDFLDQPLISDTASTIYSEIWPYRYVPDISDSAKTYLTMAFTGYRKLGNQYKSGNIFFYVFCHKSLVRTNYGFLRYDYIAGLVDEMFSEERGFGLGKLEFSSMDDIMINDDYMGISLGYKIVEFK